jgi:outer membrane protein assembly factor BamB
MPTSAAQSEAFAYRAHRMAPPVIVTAYNGIIIGHDATTGARVFAHNIGQSGLVNAFGISARVVVRAVELLVTETRIFAVAAQTVHCFEYPSGRPLGSAALGPPVFSVRPVMLCVEDRLFVGLGARLFCLDPDGRVLWSADAYHEPRETNSMSIAVPGAARQQDVDGR